MSDVQQHEEGPKKRARKRTRKSRSKAKAGEDGGDETMADTSVQQEDESIAQESMTAPQANNGASASTSASQAPQSAPAPSSSILTSNPHKPSVLPRPSIYGPRRYTLSVAIPSSIVYNAQTMELKTRLIGSVARVCAVFNVDEIVVWDDGTPPPGGAGAGAGGGGAGGQYNAQQDAQQRGRKRTFGGEEEAAPGANSNANGPFDANSFTAMILQYLETPQYLRRQLFPMHPNLRLAGLLPPLDCPHHLRFEDDSPYRDGLVVEAPHYAAAAGSKRQEAWVNVGHRDALQCAVLPGSQTPPVGSRVTVDMSQAVQGKGTLVSPRTPVQKHGLYWGYSVRLASSLSKVFTDSPFPSSAGPATPAEYDLVIGTAERGDALTDVLYATNVGHSVSSSKSPTSSSAQVSPLPPTFNHALILFGGLSGLEVAIDADPGIPLGLNDARELCDVWVDVCEGQGSRTVRTEEAVTITLARLKTTLEQRGRR